MKVARNMGANENRGVTEMRAKLVRSIGNHTRVNGVEATDIPGVELYRRSAPTACMSGQYEPKLIVFVQGKKRINVGKAIYVCGESNFLLTSINLPVVSRVIAASLKEPILGLMLKLDMPLVREILSQQEFALHEESIDARGMAVGISSLELLDACTRLVDLLDAPKDIPFLGSLIQREIIYRLLRSPQGKHLRAIATLGEPSHRAAKAVEWLRANYAKPLRVGGTCDDGADGRLDPAPSIPFSDHDEPFAVPETTAIACGQRTDAARWNGRSKRRLRSRLRKREPVQSGIQQILRSAADARYDSDPS
jgi:hypothetical protein